MCVGFWSLDNGDYSLVLCTNRDEYLSRPTAPAHWHSFESVNKVINSEPDANLTKRAVYEPECEGSVLSGIDILAGGTWFGINKRGAVALLTNITEPTFNLSSSRGHLCSSYLRRNEFSPRENTLEFVAELTASDTRYSGFNMLLLAPSCSSHPDSATNSTVHEKANSLQYDAAFVSNEGAGKPVVSLPISEQFRAYGGISNGISSGIDPFTGLRGSEWPKVVQGRHALAAILTKEESEDVLVERLFDLLRTKTCAPPASRQEFQDSILIDPVDLVRLRRGASFAQASHRAYDDASRRAHNQGETQEENLSSVESTDHGEVPARADYFGTRLSTVLLVRKDGGVLFVERDIWFSGRDAEPVLAEHEGGNDLHERRFRFRIQ